MNIIKKKLVWQKISMFALTLMISSICLVASTDAHNPGFEIYSTWAMSPPTIDGIIAPGEWEHAWTANIVNTGVVSNVTLYVMNDARHLYLAVDDENDTTCFADSGAQLGIYFDDEPAGAHDGAWTYTECPSGEGNFWLNPGTSPPQFSGIIQGADRCTVVSPVSGVLKEFSNASGHLQYEVAIDLEESPLKADTLGGDTFGFRIYVYDQDADKFDGFWPLGASWTDPSTYGDLTLSGLHERLDALLMDIERVNATMRDILEDTESHIDGRIASVEETLSTIESVIDTLKSKLDTINATMLSVSEDIETIKEQTGPAAFDWSFIAMVFSLIAAIGSIASVMLSRRKT